MVFKQRYSKMYGSNVFIHYEISYDGLRTRSHEVSYTGGRRALQIVEVISEYCQILRINANGNYGQKYIRIYQ
jgi:hypothetical protein